jgi:Spy/CpxP family protein refolding chaperone
MCLGEAPHAPPQAVTIKGIPRLMRCRQMKSRQIKINQREFMKLSKTSLAVATVSALLAISSQSQAQNTNHPARPRPAAGVNRSVDFQMDRLSEALTLTAEQKPKVKAILDEQMKKTRELRTDSASTPEDRRSKMQAIRQEANKKMKEVLTAEQFKKYEEFRQQRSRRSPNTPMGNESKVGGPAKTK